VLTLQGNGHATSEHSTHPANSHSSNGLLLASPKARLVGETDMEYYRRKKSSIVIRHVSGDRVVAMLEIMSPGNKASRHGLRAFVEKTAELLEKRIHLLIIDPFPPGRRDPQGIHSVIWEEVTGVEPATPNDKPLTLVSYESTATVRAYVESIAVGDALPDMPLFLEPGAHVPVPLEETYQRAWDAVPRRWRQVLRS